MFAQRYVSNTISIILSYSRLKRISSFMSFFCSAPEA